ncbi:O-antigen ligase family protein [Lishizhenia sp.]|uniref:O-antigen ligase family protein n=1 Tax=Lishizhenia sp. TaxID=2497594 RepID=UPI00299D2299|nr:O-antigen ligase family protein [Lishizhenia sp.]MDX1446190.1 O-antigen ligase family protein [Lishizhenia sp.]
MLDKLFGYRVHAFIHQLCFIALCVGLPLNKVVLSLATMLCILNLVLEAHFAKYLKNLRENKIVALTLLFFGFHFLGLIYTSNFDYALHDIRIKLPLFALPFVYGARPLKAKEVKIGLHLFLLSLLVTTSINYYNYHDKIEEGIILDIREMSIFGSHIRYALLVVFGAAITLFYTVKRMKYYILYALLFAWFSYYALYSQVLSGVVAYACLMGGLFFYAISKLKLKSLKWTLWILFLGAATTVTVGIVQFLIPESDNYIYGDLEYKSAQGTVYYHDTTSTFFENGYPLMVYLAEDEMRKKWNERSDLAYDSLDRKNQHVKYTLWRYLTSKNLRKDAQGVAQLTEEDVRFIEQGIPSIEFQNGGVTNRLNGLKTQLQTYAANGNPNGHSLLQRFEHWSAAWYIIKNNPYFGVGTGDVQDEFDKAYDDLDSKLDKYHRNRAHNQFLTVWITFGIPGLILFLSIWFLFLKRAVSNKHILALAFGLIALASFLPEDTIETQQGVTFIALFLAVFSSQFYQKSEA